MSTAARLTISPVLRGVLIERFKRTCQYCGRQSESISRGPDNRPWHIDHIMPTALGGPSEEANYTLSCATCNGDKNYRMPESDWRARPRSAPPKIGGIPTPRTSDGAEEITIAEAAERCGLHIATLRTQVKRGRILGIKRRRDWYVRWSDVLAYLESRDHRGRYRKDVQVPPHSPTPPA